jgi:hypothetical protein
MSDNILSVIIGVSYTAIMVFIIAVAVSKEYYVLIAPSVIALFLATLLIVILLKRNRHIN